jgi:MFS family permease
MYSQNEIDEAVAAGAISPDSATALRAFVEGQRALPTPDEEQFRLITGFNDIFVSIALVLLLVALAWIGGDSSAALAGALVAGASWGLAEYFTRRRRMALPSILLLLSFVGGIAATMIGALVDFNLQDTSNREAAVIMAGVGLVTAGATFGHWLRFRVPITVAAGAVSVVAVAVALALAAVPGLEQQVTWLVLIGGIATFAFAMWWDMSDRTRQTRRSDVAFWLHLVAAPMIAHPIFHQLGVLDGMIGTAQAALVLALYVIFALISLSIDRRALLVSSLAYVLYAMSALFERFGAVSLSVALTGLVIGSALLMLSAFWHPVRRMVVRTLPDDMREKLPVIDRPVVA